jgi:hypothetical protein
MYFSSLEIMDMKPSQVKRLNLTSENLHVRENIVVHHCKPHWRDVPRSKIQSETFVT